MSCAGGAHGAGSPPRALELRATSSAWSPSSSSASTSSSPPRGAAPPAAPPPRARTARMPGRRAAARARARAPCAASEPRRSRSGAPPALRPEEALEPVHVELLGLELQHVARRRVTSLWPGPVVRTLAQAGDEPCTRSRGRAAAARPRAPRSVGRSRRPRSRVQEERQERAALLTPDLERPPPSRSSSGPRTRNCT